MGQPAPDELVGSCTILVEGDLVERLLRGEKVPLSMDLSSGQEGRGSQGVLNSTSFFAEPPIFSAGGSTAGNTILPLTRISTPPSSIEQLPPTNLV